MGSSQSSVPSPTKPADTDEQPEANKDAPDEFVTKAPTEVKKFTWRIKDYCFRLDGDTAANPSMEFRIGAKIGLDSKWKMDIYPKDCNSIGWEQPKRMCLSVSRLVSWASGGEPETKNFCFNCTIKLKPKNRSSHDLPCCKVIRELDKTTQEFELDVLSSKIGDELVIHVEFVIWKSNFVTTTEKDAIFKESGVLDNYADLLESGDNSDFVIEVRKFDGYEEHRDIIQVMTESSQIILHCFFKHYSQSQVHKAILSARSSVFKTMLDTQMQERTNGVLIIRDLSIESVQIMLKYIYTGKLDQGWKNLPEEMVRAADKYDLPILLDFLDRRLHSVCTVANALKLRRLAKLHQLDTAVKNINTFIASSIDNILF